MLTLNLVVRMLRIDHRRDDADAPHFGQHAARPVRQRDLVQRQRPLMPLHLRFRLSVGQELRRKLGQRRRRLERGQHHPQDGAEHQDQTEDEVAVGQPVGPVAALTAARRGEHFAEARHRRVPAWLPSSAARQPQLNERQQQQRHREHERGRGGEAVLPDRLGEPGGVDELDDERRRRTRTAAGQYEHLVEDLHRADEPQHEHHDEIGHQQRQRDPPESPPGRCAVHFGGLVEIGRNRLQARQQDQRVEAHVRPDADERRPRRTPRCSR